MPRPVERECHQERYPGGRGVLQRKGQRAHRGRVTPMGCRTRSVLGWLLLVMPLLALPAVAQGPNNEKWSSSLEPRAAAPGSKVLAGLEGQIDPGWHLYSMTSAGAIPTTIKVAANAAVEKIRVFPAPPKKAYDPNFQLDTETYEGSAFFLVELQLKPENRGAFVSLRIKLEVWIVSLLGRRREHPDLLHGGIRGHLDRGGNSPRAGHRIEVPARVDLALQTRQYLRSRRCGPRFQ